jgi:hypothetical protein
MVKKVSLDRLEMEEPSIVTSETLKDFLTPLREDDKNKNVLVIDVIFEIDPAHHALFLQKISLIRASTFKALSEKAVDIVRGKNGIDAVRSKIIASAETLIEKDFVKRANCKSPCASYRRKTVSSLFKIFWTPAFAGGT